MSFADEIAEQRKTRAAAQATRDDHDESVQAVLSTGSDMVGSTDKLAKSEDIDSVIKQLKELQLSQLLEAQAAKIPKPDKPTIILTDQTDLGDRLSKLADDIASSVDKLDTTKVNADQLQSLKELKDALNSYTDGLTGSNTANQKAASDLLKAVKAIRVSPVVNVPEAKITVQAPKVDLQPLQDTLKEYFKPPETDESINLESYRAQDIDNINPNMQYIGFMNPQGNWYIIENDVKGNKLRYLFGDDGYTQAFSDAASHVYSLLNEAIDALSA